MAIALVFCGPLLGADAPAASATPAPTSTPAPSEVKPGAVLTIVSPHWQGLRWEIARGFERWHEEKFGVPVRVRYLDIGGTSGIERYITNNPAAVADIDVMFGGGTDPFTRLARLGYFQPVQLPPRMMAELPADIFGVPLRDKDLLWISTYASVFGILVNKQVRDWAKVPDAHSWEDLADPRLQSWVSSGDPRQSGSIFAMYEIILQAYQWEHGWRVILGMSGNVRSFLKSASSSVKEATFGETAYALSIDSYGLAQQVYLGGNMADYRVPPGKSVCSGDSVAIFRQAPNSLLAQRFVQFTVSREGQLLVMLPRGVPGGAVRYEINRMTVRPELYEELGDRTPVRLNPFREKLGFLYDVGLAASRRSVLQGLLGAWAVDMHAELRAAWAAVNALPPERAELKARLLQRLLAPPLSLDEIRQIYTRVPTGGKDKAGKPEMLSPYEDPVRRNQLILQWQRAAAQRYGDVLREAKAGG